MSVQEYLIIIEPTETGFSAYSPDLPGCITVGETVEQTREYMQEAMELYIEELTENGEQIPPPRKLNEQVSTITALQTGSFIALVPTHTGFAKSA